MSSRLLRHLAAGPPQAARRAQVSPAIVRVELPRGRPRHQRHAHAPVRIPLDPRTTPFSRRASAARCTDCRTVSRTTVHGPAQSHRSAYPPAGNRTDRTQWA